DAVGAIGFGAAAALGYRNYRDTDAEAAFWMAFTFASLLGVTWTVSLMLEKAGVATQIFNLATGPLMATTVAVFAIGGTATLAIVEDMEALVEERAQRRQEAEEERAEAERAREKAEQKQAEAERQTAEAESAKQDARERSAEIEQLAADLESQATEVGATLEAASDGDLTARVDATTDNAEIAEVATVVNDMLTTMERTIDEIQGFSTNVTTASREATAGAKEIQDASQTVSESVQEIAAGTDDQREQLESVAEEMDSYSATVEEVAATAQSVADTAADTTDVATAGKQT
ncbi:methyl-accepting chemotaxis protein, partial [Halobacterium salinarum]|nr:methyl-accepting chemotaxis protein [Halobacterium salinarum]